MRKNKNTGGFTLMELVIVIAIMTILLGLSLPRLSAYAQNAREIERADHETLVQKAIRQYYAYEGSYPDLKDLSPDDGSRTLTEAQETELHDKLRSVTTTRINVTDYQYEYNEQTGVCTLTRS